MVQLFLMVGDPDTQIVVGADEIVQQVDVSAEEHFDERAAEGTRITDNRRLLSKIPPKYLDGCLLGR
jgi:hypothetical protein